MSQGPDQQTETASAPVMSITRSVSAPAKTEDRVSAMTASLAAAMFGSYSASNSAQTRYNSDNNYDIIDLSTSIVIA